MNDPIAEVRAIYAEEAAPGVPKYGKFYREQARELLAEIDRLNADLAAKYDMIRQLRDRVAAQSELLGRKAERPVPLPPFPVDGGEGECD